MIVLNVSRLTSNPGIKFEFLCIIPNGDRLYKMNDNYSGLSYIIKITQNEEIYVVDDELMYKSADKLMNAFNKALYDYIKKYM